MLGVGACGVDTLIREMTDSLSLGSSILGSGGLSVALACSDLSAQDIELGRMDIQTAINEGMTYSYAISQIAPGCQNNPVFSSQEACNACGNALINDAYGF